ncbi:unnamed protein product, partial [Chrysoparadoxa australica]
KSLASEFAGPSHMGNSSSHSKKSKSVDQVSAKGHATASRSSATNNLRDAVAVLPGAKPRNKTGSKVTAQKVKTAAATGILSLAEHGLKQIPSDVIAIAKMTTLDLTSNALRELPIGLTTLTKLKTLRLDGNKLESLIDLSSLPVLSDVSAANNRLQAAAVMGLPQSLKKLDLSGNQLHEVPGAVTSLGNLTVLALMQCQLDLLPPLPGLTQLLELSLDGNKITVVEAYVAEMPKLKTLSLRHNKIGAQAFGRQSLAAALFTSSQVEVLNLEGNLLDKQALLAMDGVNAFLERRLKAKNKNIHGGAHFTDLSICGLD